MGEQIVRADLVAGLDRALARVGYRPAERVERLTGGATMESWRFTSGDRVCILKRAPDASMMHGRAFGHETEAAVITAARGSGVAAPEIVAVLQPADGLGSGYIMRALPGTPEPRAIQAMGASGAILHAAARELAAIHTLPRRRVPVEVPAPDYGASLAALDEQFAKSGGDRPIIALGLRWLADNLPAPVDPVLNHGDFRLGNLLCEAGRLTGVLDWELAHFGDPHEDLAFACLPVWRFGRRDLPALGLGSLEEFFAVYEEAGGRTVDPARFRFWTVFRTVWWALGCLKNARLWREGSDRMLERVVISRRTSEQEVDLLLLLEDEAPAAERDRAIDPPRVVGGGRGEADIGEIAAAISEWLATIKDRMTGHDRFQLAVARNALGIVARESTAISLLHDKDLALKILSGAAGLETPGLLARLRRDALDKLATDGPRYPALAIARRKWTGED